ncbi:V/A-type H+-transporting ATPase subunit I [Halohasta litchfieldiae]|jgi:V/A-type H+-transporting ATPase subunit I|uniref:A-type ATP synthase subunit I n=1 Tax=Halohasta litchfieldiae TaxID=1073996 RepID=A0A1H6QTL1_9EURY|nr:V-type ATP synthase subunit I [Halohasta litchfieldiae]ATW88691.1 V/A-type H+-transporting ATPase subunit I [Halohasta litchfieldiae]SEI46903.1 V/A-type H+-transporting ATPase subunit I [Halohasta litchfieldiae]
MLRPERMSKVSVAGSKRVLESTIEAVYEMRVLHLSEYDESWDSFNLGHSLESSEETNDKLVTVRALESILDVTDEDADEEILVDDEMLATELSSLQETVNELDDRRSELRTQLRELDEEIDAVEPFADLGIDLDLLSGYDSLVVSVGQGNREAIESTLAESDGIDTFDIMSGSRTHAIFAKPTADAEDDVLADALVGVDFATIEIPDAEGSPEAYVEELEAEKESVQADLDEVEAELESIKANQAGFLLSAEEYLSIEAQKKQAPLSFATTKNAFVAEGWIPSERYEEFKTTLTEAVDGPLDIDEVKRAQFKSDGDHHVEDVEPEPPAVDEGATPEQPSTAEESATADGGEKARTDGGSVTMGDDTPPIVQNNPGIVKPFEVLIQAVSRPNYKEFDPTIILFLTFPAFFGFMIGDVGYGIIYSAIGYFLYANYPDSPGFRSMGGVTIAAGLFTILFGFLYGEFFGLHVIATYFWEGVVGLAHAPIEKGLSPAGVDWATGWLVVSVLVGIMHLNIAWIFGFFEDLQIHDLKHAIYENGSWIIMMNALWIWIFSDALRGTVPDFIFTTFSADGVLPLGFTGFPAMTVFATPVGDITAPLLVFFLGLGLLAYGEPIEVVEFLNVLVNVLSYTRLAAVLLAKAGMAFTVNLLFFGVWVTETPSGASDWHFGLQHSPAYYVEQGTYHGEEVTGVLFGGLVHGDIATLLLGLVVLVLGHILVLALGVTSAGLQAVRLEYVEFFNKFFEGGGRAYNPFGYERTYTASED